MRGRIGDEPFGIQYLMEQCPVADAYRIIHENNQDFNTHKNGSTSLDYLLCTPSVL
jgi:hypothetical protein